jgi:CRP-like cAMP-binding protein
MLFGENSPSDACFVIVKGTVDMSFDANGGQKLLAHLGPSSMCGQVALPDGGQDSGTCTVRQDGLLLEMKHDACHRLLASHSPRAYKFLAALTEGVIHTLHAAGRQLKRPNTHPRDAGSSRRR